MLFRVVSTILRGTVTNASRESWAGRLHISSPVPSPTVWRRSFATVHNLTPVPDIRPSQQVLSPPRITDGRIQIFSDVKGDYVPIPNVWLRDNCRCTKCFHTVTNQRLVETFDEIPLNVAIAEDGVQDSPSSIAVKWEDGHESVYSKEWLAASGLKKDPRSTERQAVVQPVFWSGAGVENHPPSVKYGTAMNSDDGLKELLLNIRKFGFTFIDDCPPTAEATEQLLRRIAFIRNTHYGGFWEFKPDLSSSDTAYTQLGIGAHTDNTYFSDPAGLQMFHLLSEIGVEGGASQLIDGFGAAAELLERFPEAYKILSTVRVHSHASGGDISIQPWNTLPVLVHDDQAGFLTQVRWNTTDRGAIDTPMEEMDAWYDAARNWASILRKREYWDQLKPGKPLIFDNWRVLHGRTAFTGDRRMCGGYINRDDFISKFKLINWGKEKCLEQVSRG
jgi:trimethyllysine dioxygenase